MLLGLAGVAEVVVTGMWDPAGAASVAGAALAPLGIDQGLGGCRQWQEQIMGEVLPSWPFTDTN